MGYEARWRRRYVPSESSLFQNNVLPLADPGIDVAEPVDGRAPLCDCHRSPMYHFPVSLMPDDDFVMCWVAECGRCYNKSLGYFHLRRTRPTRPRMDERTRTMALCPNEICPPCSSMAITRAGKESGDDRQACWYCFHCGMEFPLRKVRGAILRRG